MEQSDINLDKFIQSRLRHSRVFDGGVEPSADFTSRTMARIIHAQKRRRMTRDVYAVCLSLMPLVVHQGWLRLVSGKDYFTVSSWPLGGYVAGAYHVFLSSLGLELVLIAGISIFISYKRSHRLRPAFAKTA